jgi:hypothetical protein
LFVLLCLLVFMVFFFLCCSVSDFSPFTNRSPRVRAARGRNPRRAPRSGPLTKSGLVRAKSLKPPCSSRTKDLKTNLNSGQTERIRRARSRGACYLERRELSGVLSVRGSSEGMALCGP